MRWVPVRKRAENVAVTLEVLCFVLRRQAALANIVFLPLGTGHGGGLATQNDPGNLLELLGHIPGVH